MHDNGVFRNFQRGPENFRAPKTTENMHFITTKCIVTLTCMRDVYYYSHSRPTHADKIIQCWRCIYIAKLQL